MNVCLLCGGVGELPDRKVHFGDGMEKDERCPACLGGGVVEIIPTRRRTITIIKPHGVWKEDPGGGAPVK